MASKRCEEKEEEMMAYKQNKLLTEDEVDGENDLNQLVDWMEELKVGIDDNIETKEDMRRYIKLGLLMKQHDCHLRQRISETLINIKTSDDTKRERLHELCEESYGEKLGNINKDICYRNLRDVLEKRVPNFLQMFQDKVALLKDHKCPILIAGEASAGKSSFMNLLLGQDLLPCSHLSNTSVICEISYGQKRSARIHYWDVDKKPIEIEDSTDFEQALSGYLHSHDRDEKWDYKRAEIFLPLEILKAGLFIVDSPGVGENHLMTELILDYMHNAFAFIYIINSANAGGVQEDRIGILFDKALERNRQLFKDPERLSAEIIPQAMIFICNKWDQVKVEERSPVRNDILTKLKKVFPRLDEKHQVFYTNTLDAAWLQKRGYNSKDMLDVLTGIEYLVPRGLNIRLLSVFSWIQGLFMETIDIVHAFDNESKQNDAIERNERISQQIGVLDEIEKDLVVETTKLFDMVQAKKKKLEQIFRDKVKRNSVGISAAYTSSVEMSPKLKNPLQMDDEEIDKLLKQHVTNIVNAVLQPSNEQQEIDFTRHACTYARDVLLEISGVQCVIENRIAAVDAMLKGFQQQSYISGMLALARKLWALVDMLFLDSITNALTPKICLIYFEQFCSDTACKIKSLIEKWLVSNKKSSIHYDELVHLILYDTQTINDIVSRLVEITFTEIEIHTGEVPVVLGKLLHQTNYLAETLRDQYEKICIDSLNYQELLAFILNSNDKLNYYADTNGLQNSEPNSAAVSSSDSHVRSAGSTLEPIIYLAELGMRTVAIGFGLNGLPEVDSISNMGDLRLLE